MSYHITYAPLRSLLERGFVINILSACAIFETNSGDNLWQILRTIPVQWTLKDLTPNLKKHIFF